MSVIIPIIDVSVNGGFKAKSLTYQLQLGIEIKDNNNRDVIPVLSREKEKLRYARVFSLLPKKTGI